MNPSANSDRAVIGRIQPKKVAVDASTGKIIEEFGNGSQISGGGVSFSDTLGVIKSIVAVGAVAIVVGLLYANRKRE